MSWLLGNIFGLTSPAPRRPPEDGLVRRVPDGGAASPQSPSSPSSRRRAISDISNRGPPVPTATPDRYAARMTQSAVKPFTGNTNKGRGRSPPGSHGRTPDRQASKGRGKKGGKGKRKKREDKENVGPDGRPKPRERRFGRVAGGSAQNFLNLGAGGTSGDLVFGDVQRREGEADGVFDQHPFLPLAERGGAPVAAMPAGVPEPVGEEAADRGAEFSEKMPVRVHRPVVLKDAGFNHHLSVIDAVDERFFAAGRGAQALQLSRQIASDEDPGYEEPSSSSANDTSEGERERRERWLEAAGETRDEAGSGVLREEAPMQVDSSFLHSSSDLQRSGVQG